MSSFTIKSISPKKITSQDDVIEVTWEATENLEYVYLIGKCEDNSDCIWELPIWTNHKASGVTDIRVTDGEDWDIETYIKRNPDNKILTEIPIKLFCQLNGSGDELDTGVTLTFAPPIPTLTAEFVYIRDSSGSSEIVKDRSNLLVVFRKNCASSVEGILTYDAYNTLYTQLYVNGIRCQLARQGDGYLISAKTTMLEAGTNTFEVDFRTRRRFSTRISGTFEVVAYSESSIGKLLAIRTDSITSKTEAVASTDEKPASFGYISVPYELDSNAENATIHAYYRKNGDSDDAYTEIGSGVTVSEKIGVAEFHVAGLDETLQYEIKVELADNLASNPVFSYAWIAPFFVLMHFSGSTGKSVAFGKIDEGYGFEVALDAYFRKKVELGEDVWIRGKPFLDAHYPIGSIYMSVVDTSPSELFGGTWERIKGRFLVGIDEEDSDFTEGGTGGHKQLQSHTHTFSGSSNHSHPCATSGKYFLIAPDTQNGDSGSGISGSGYVYPRSATSGWEHHTVTGAATATISGTTSSTGGGDSQNLPPYLAVYIWQRTA